MAKFVFTKDQENIQGTMYGIASGSFDLSAINITSASYKIIDATDAEYDNVRLDKKNCYYDANGLVWNNNTCTFATLERLQEIVSTMKETSYAAHNQCITDLKAQTFDNYTFPLNKTIPEIAEDKGITWVSHLQFV